MKAGPDAPRGAFGSAAGALIFDLDGTLWDSSTACTSGWNKARETLGVGQPVEVADVRGAMGLPHGKVFEKVFPKVPSGERVKLADACYDEELEAIRRDPPGLYPGVSAGLRSLTQHYPLFLVSNCLVDYLETFYSVSGLKELFREGLCHGHTGKTKGDNLKDLVKRHGISDGAYIGDTAGDQRAAREAGLTYFHVDYGFGEPERECLRFHDFPELTAFFLSHPCG